MSSSRGKTMTRRDKVRSIFDRFDINGDGGLNRSEMAALVAAVNPNVKFSSDQIYAILEEVFRTYSDFISDPEAGLRFDGLLRTYDDGAGDVDRDFAALSLQVIEPQSSPNPNNPNNPNPNSRVLPAWAASPNNGITYDATWRIIEDVDILIRRQIRSQNCSKFTNPNPNDSVLGDGFSESGWSREFGNVEFDGKNVFWDESCGEFRVLMKELKEIRVRIDRASTRDEVFDGHMAIGRTLYDYRLFKEALESFKRSVEINPVDVRPHFRMGNSLCSLGQLKEAKVCYQLALDLAEMDSSKWSTLLPQIHVNLGISMEGDGMLLGASEHYREAAILCPTHYRALKHLGSALFGVGEYKAAEKALEEAVLLKPDYPDAHCDFGSVLHAMGEEERAILEFQKVIDLKPDHLDALYNLGGLFMDVGRYRRAGEMYGRVLAIQPNHWQAQLNRAVSLLGAGETDEAKKALRDAFEMTNRVELYYAITHLKLLQKKPRGGLSSAIKKELDSEKVDRVDVITVEPSLFKRASEKATHRELLANALRIRAFQRAAKLDRCDVTLLHKEMAGLEAPVSYLGSWAPEKVVRKSTLEVILRKLFHFLKPENFQGAVKAIDERVFAILDITGSGRLDLGMFYAVIAPLCAGPPEKRKRAVFDALLWRSVKGGVQGQIRKADASTCMRYLRVIYFPSQGWSDLMEVRGEEENTLISFPEFLQMFDDPDWGFGILSTLVKLETSDRIRHCGKSCAVCRYPIIGPRFKEITSRFSLCAMCYSEGKVPSTHKQDEYRFKEYWSEAEAMKDKLWLFGSHPDKLPDNA